LVCRHSDDTDAGLERLEAYRIKPTVVIDSGNGIHAYFEYATPQPAGNSQDPDGLLFQRRNQALIEDLGGDPQAKEISRIMRLPGSRNIPNERKRKKGRVEGLAKIVSHNPERVYQPEHFEERETPRARLCLARSKYKLHITSRHGRKENQYCEQYPRIEKARHRALLCYFKNVTHVIYPNYRDFLMNLPTQTMNGSKSTVFARQFGQHLSPVPRVRNHRKSGHFLLPPRYRFCS
jgi:RepB DNA-primase N-terminal domain